METTNDKAGAMLETLKSEIGEKPVSLQLKIYRNFPLWKDKNARLNFSGIFQEVQLIHN